MHTVNRDREQSRFYHLTGNNVRERSSRSCIIIWQYMVLRSTAWAWSVFSRKSIASMSYLVFHVATAVVIVCHHQSHAGSISAGCICSGRIISTVSGNVIRYVVHERSIRVFIVRTGESLVVHIIRVMWDRSAVKFHSPVWLTMQIISIPAVVHVQRCILYCSARKVSRSVTD